MNERESDCPDPDLRAGAGVRSQGAKDGPGMGLLLLWVVAPPAEPTVSPRPAEFLCWDSAGPAWARAGSVGVAPAITNVRVNSRETASTSIIGLGLMLNVLQWSS